MSKKVGLILGAIVLVAALVSLYVVYSHQAGERNALEDRLDKAQDRLPGLTASKNDLTDQLASATSSLNEIRSKFPESIESIEYGEYLFKMAHACNVNLASLSFPKPAAKSVGSVTYSVVSLSLPISGSLDNIFKFIDTIRTDPRFASTEVKTINIAIGGAETSAVIAVDIYGYKG